MTRTAVALAVAALLVACGGASGPGAVPTADGPASPASPDSPVGTTAPTGPTPGAPGGTAERVEPVPGMVDVHPVGFERAEVLGARTVEVTWWSGVRPCHVLTRVDVASGPEQVTITVYEGSEPSDEPVACIELAKRKRTTVELSEPLDGREIADGAPQ